MSYKDKELGKIVRVSPHVRKLLQEKRRGNESFDSVIRRLIGSTTRRGILKIQSYFVLPEDMHESKSRARGAAVIRKFKTLPTPVEMKEVL